MGFRLGHFLGKLAGTAISTATGGKIRPHFNRPGGPKPHIVPGYGLVSAPAGSYVMSQSSTSLPGFQSRSSDIYVAPSGAGGGYDGGGSAADVSPGTAMTKPGCALVWNGHRFVTTHPNKSTYVTRGGGTSRWPQQLLVHPKGTECVTHRRMNPGNGHAAIHALRRLVAFHHLAKRVESAMHRIAPKRARGGSGHSKGCGCRAK